MSKSYIEQEEEYQKMSNDLMTIQSDKDISIQINKFNEMLEQSISICNENRDVAKKTYEMLEKQLSNVIKIGLEQSSDGVLEREMNKAVSNIISATKVLENTINAISKIVAVKIASNSKERIADKIVNNNPNHLDSPLNINDVLNNEN